MNSNFMMNTDEVMVSGQNQKSISEGFNASVQRIFETIESLCASEWLGLSSDTYNNLTNTYREPMRQLGELIDSHGQKDITSANRVEETDQSLSANISANL